MRNVTSMHRELAKHATVKTDRVAMKDAHSAVTFGELDARVNQVARALRESGFEPGDRLALLLPNRLEWGEIQYGCFRAGVAPAGLNFRWAPEQMATVIDSIDADGFLFDAQYADHVAEIEDEIDVPDDRYIELGTETAYQSYESWRDERSTDRPPFDGVDVNDPAVIWFTSGTTGQPKPIIWTQRNLINHAFYSAYALRLNDSASSFLLMPLFHANSQLYFTGSLYVGADVYVHRATGFDPDETLGLIAAEESTYTSMVPTHYTRIVHETDVDEYDLSSLSVVMSSSAPLSRGLKQEIIDSLDCAVVEGYGASETGIPILLRPGLPGDKIGSIGVPAAGCDAAILDPETLEPLGPGEIGEIYMRVPSGMEGYLELPDKTDEVVIERDGQTWMTVGDMGRVDEDGFFYIENRKDDMIITGGENVYPSHIEEVLYEHDAIKDVAVVGVPNERWGELVQAVAISTGDARPDIDELREFCRGKVADYELPKQIKWVEELPRNQTGKILRDDVREQLTTEHGTADDEKET